jgi:hypothetical protein
LEYTENRAYVLDPDKLEFTGLDLYG